MLDNAEGRLFWVGILLSLFFLLVFVLSVAWIIYRIVENPEAIGDWFRRLGGS